MNKIFTNVNICTTVERMAEAILNCRHREEDTIICGVVKDFLEYHVTPSNSLFGQLIGLIYLTFWICICPICQYHWRVTFIVTPENNSSFNQVTMLMFNLLC